MKMIFDKLNKKAIYISSQFCASHTIKSNLV